MKRKSFVLSITSRQLVLLLDLLEFTISDLDAACSLLELDSKNLKVFSEYQEVYNILKSLL